MERKRSRGVTIFAWFWIVLNAYTFIISLDFHSFQGPFGFLPHTFVMVVAIHSLLSSFIGFVVGIGLLKLKEIMRKTGIVVNSVDLLVGIILFFLSFNGWKQYSYEKAASALAKTSAQVNIDLFAGIGFYLIISLYLAFTLLNVLFIYFFTRPKVKEQFR